MHGLAIGNHLAANVRMILSPQNRSLNWIDADQTITPMQYEPRPMWSRMRADQLVVVKILRNGQTQRRVRGRGPKLRLVISRKCKSRLGIYIAKHTFGCCYLGFEVARFRWPVATGRLEIKSFG